MRVAQRLLLFVLSLSFSGFVQAQFGAAQGLPISSPDDGLTLIDMDLDGYPDLVGLFFDDHIKWARNNDGLGDFDGMQLIVPTGNAPLHYTIVDLHLDGLPDVVYVDEDHHVRTVRNLGNGSFDAPQWVGQLPDGPGAMACKDISGDGLPDLVFSLPAGYSGSGFGWYPNTGTGFSSLIVEGGVVQGPASPILLIGDLDLVGGADVVLQDGNGTIRIQRNLDGDGMTWTEDVLLSFPAYDYLDPILLDVDADGDLDIAEAGGSMVHWGENRVDEGGSWIPFTDHVLESGTEAGTGHFGGVGCGVGASVIYLPEDDALAMRWRTYLPELNELSYAGDLSLERGIVLLIGDIDGDGRNDLVIERPSGRAWHKNTSSETVTLLEMPVLDTLCVFGPPIVLPAMDPSGGRWSGNWVIDGVLHRANLGSTGNYPIAHTVYEDQGCPVAGISPILLLNGPIVTPDLVEPLCSGIGPIQLETVPFNVEWSGIDQNGIIDPATFAGGSFACAWTDNTGMECATVVGPVFVWSSVPVSIGTAGPFCVTDAVQAISAGILPPQGGTWSGDIAGTIGDVALFNPGVGAGTYQVSLHVEPSGPQQCANDDTILITVSDDIPTVSIDPIPVHCENGSAIVLGGAAPAGGTWSGTAVQGGVMEPSLAGSGVHVLSYTYHDPGGCSGTQTVSIELVDQVQVSWNVEDLLVCTGDEPVQFTAIPNGGNWSAPVEGNGVLDPGNLPPGPLALHYAWMGPNGCSLQNEELIVTIQLMSEVYIASLSVLCDDGPPVQLIGNIPGTWSGALSGEGDIIWFDPAGQGAGVWNVVLDATEPGSCPGSANMDIVVEVCTGIGELDALFGSAIAPNPFNSELWLTLEGNGSVAVEVLDGVGRSVRTLNATVNGRTTLPIDMTGEASGSYVIRLSVNGRAQYLRAIKVD